VGIKIILQKHLVESMRMLDAEYNPKLVYNTLIKFIKGDYMTKNIKLTANKKGEASFRGFFWKL